ncbi:MAG TPA: biopolymer transporter ExbD [Bdellovibrionales bacterium]|nr:biopolymer transporter ExbD [Bdellovibrionales bacterium]
MPIYVPGKRNRHGKKGGGKRSSVVALNMTAMVDMFTVLCVFLLQNYATTNQVLPMPEKVDLPSAHEVKELTPSNVVLIAEDGIMLNNVRVADFRAVKEQKEWEIKALIDLLEKTVKEGEQKKKTLGSQLRQAVADAKQIQKPVEIDEFRKITIQSDKNVDFLTVKKVMYSVTESGMQEINFAVMKKPDSATPL